MYCCVDSYFNLVLSYRCLYFYWSVQIMIVYCTVPQRTVLYVGTVRPCIHRGIMIALGTEFKINYSFTLDKITYNLVRGSKLF